MNARRTTFLAVALLACGAAAVFAQRMVNTQIYGSPAPTVRYAPQYLRSAPYVPSSSMAMPSEVRNAYAVTGATPSSIRMNAAALGPLAPGGPSSYISPPPQFNRPAVAQGNLVNTGVTGPISPIQAAPFAPIGGTGSVRYNSPAFTPIPGALPSPGPAPQMSSASLTPAPIGGPVSSNPFASTSVGTGNVRYGGS